MVVSQGGLIPSPSPLFTAIKLRKKIFKNKNMRSINLSFRPARELEKCRSSKLKKNIKKKVRTAKVPEEFIAAYP